MADDDGLSSDYEANVLNIAGDGPAKMFLLATLSPPDAEPEEIDSVVAELSHKPPVSWRLLYEHEGWLTDLDRSPGGGLFCVSADGELHALRGRKWSVLDLGCPDGLNAVWAASDDEVFAVGVNGARVRVGPGGAVDRVLAKEERWLHDVHGTARDSVYAVGDDGWVWHFDGKKWQEIDCPTNYHLLCVLCVSPTEVYAAGEAGIVYRYDGEDWTRMRCPEVTVTGLAVYREEVYAAAGADGVWRWDGKEFVQLKELDVSALRVAGGRLFAVGGRLVAQYDGSGWWGGDLDL
jgi:hypothetical protein